MLRQLTRRLDKTTARKDGENVALLTSFISQLGRLLLRGFERLVGRSVSRGLSIDVIESFIRGKEPSLSRAASRAMAEFVQAGQRAAQLIETGNPNDPLPVGEFPVNELLLDPDPLGDSYIVDGEVWIYDDEGNFLRKYGNITVRDSVMLTNGEVLEAMKQQAIDKFMDTDERAIHFKREQLDAAIAKLSFAERKY